MTLAVVTGPPAAGKTTYVRHHAQPGDIIIDLDRIAAALSIEGDTHDHPRHLLRVAYRARGVAIDEALRHCDGHDVWIIHTDPKPDTLARYQAHGARLITIDPGRDVVMARIATERPATARAVATRWYNQHEHEPTRQAAPTVTSRAW